MMWLILIKFWDFTFHLYKKEMWNVIAINILKSILHFGVSTQLLVETSAVGRTRLNIRT